METLQKNTVQDEVMVIRDKVMYDIVNNTKHINENLKYLSYLDGEFYMFFEDKYKYNFTDLYDQEIVTLEEKHDVNIYVFTLDMAHGMGGKGIWESTRRLRSINGT